MKDISCGWKDRHQLHMELPELAVAANTSQPLTLLLLTVRDFALWQRQLTPLAADSLLQLVAETIISQLPSGAHAARWDHAVFAVLLPQYSGWQAEALGEQLREAWQRTGLPPALEMLTLAPDLCYGTASTPPTAIWEMPALAESRLKTAQGGLFARLRCDAEYSGVTAGQVEQTARDAYIYLATHYLAHHDAYLQRHGQLTAGFAQEVGRKLGLGNVALSELAQAAAFADLAMTEVGGSTLDKPGCLTRSEFNRICRHPTLAADLVEQLGLSQGVAQTVRFHHERSDGGGYPHGLSSEEIPLSAAILGCCGAYAAMLLPRPYRPARKLYHIRAELSQLSGRAWPSDVTRAVIALSVDHGVLPKQAVR